MNREERLLLNLRILSKVPEHGRLKHIKTGLIALEDRTRWQGLFRTLTQDNRMRCLDDVRGIIDDSMHECQIRPIDPERLGQFFKSFLMAIPGLQRLRFTYSTDITMVAALDLLIEKIQAFCHHLQQLHPHLVDSSARGIGPIAIERPKDPEPTGLTSFATPQSDHPSPSDIESKDTASVDSY